MVICRFYQQGCCRYGDSCRFEHPRERFDDVVAVSPLLRSSQQHSVPGPRVQHNPQNVFGSRQHPHSQSNFPSRSQSHDQNTFNSRPTNGAADVRDIYKILIQELEISERSGQWPLSCLNPVPSRVHGNIPGLEDHSPEELRCLLYEAHASGGLETCKQQIQLLYQQAQARKNALKNSNTEVLSILETLIRGPIPSTQEFTFSLPGGVAHDSWPTTNVPPETSAFSGVFTRSQPNAFGASSIPHQQTSIFGGATNPTTQSIFGGGTPTQPSVFGNSSSVAFGTPVSSSNIFGGFSSQNNYNGTSQNSGFVGPSSAASTFTFKLPDDVGTGPSTTSSMFGGVVAHSQNILGVTGNEQRGGVFSGFQPIPSVQATENSFFQMNNTQKLNTAVSVSCSSLHTEFDALTPEEKNEFTATTFTVGKIPVRPPPKELCD